MRGVWFDWDYPYLMSPAAVCGKKIWSGGPFTLAVSTIVKLV